ncbi:MAG: glycosyltransferase [Lapillicoccus sp.]
MATVLAYTSPALGHLFPMVPLLLELRDRGHDVHVRTLASAVDDVRALGLAAQPVDPRIAQIVHPDWEATNPRAALQVAVRTFGGRAALDGPDLTAAVAEVRPDVVVVDINAWGASLAAEAWGGPWVCFSPYTPPISSAGTPPFGPGLAPLPGLRGRLRDGVVRPIVMGAAERVMRPTMNALRRGYGQSPLRTADEFFGRAPMIVTTAEPLEYPHPDWAGRVHLVGALPWEPPAPTPAWVEAIEGPVALVTTSSEYQADEQLVRTAFAALADQPWTVVATMPAGVGDVGPLPANARLVDFVPHSALLDRAVVAVTHGGMGATQKALARGIPVCVVPFGRDQLEVAARVVHAEAGTSLAVKKLSPVALRGAVRAAVGCVEGARRVAEGFRRAGGAPAAADVVEGLVNRAPSSPTA